MNNVKETVVPATATATPTNVQSANASYRGRSLYNETGAVLHWAVADEAPADTTTMKPLPDGTGIEWDVLKMPVGNLYIAGSGAANTVKVGHGL